MSPADEVLGAYVDGELEPSARAELEAAMASQPELAARVERLRRTNARLRSAFDGVLEEPVPPRLTKTVHAAPRRESWPSRWSWPEWGAMAASVTLGVVIGHFLLRGAPGDGLFRQQGSQLFADGTLAGALSTQLAGTQPAGGVARVGLSFRARSSGNYCRTFTLPASPGIAGIACREGEEWSVQALTRTDLSNLHGEARQAGTSLPAELLAIVRTEIEGEPLDAAAEEAALRRNWSTDR